MNIFKSFRNMPAGTHVGDAGPADNPNSPTAQPDDSREAPIVAIPVANPIASMEGTPDSVARQMMEAVDHDRHCTLTIGEAQSLFSKNLRHPLSKRSLQRYCQKGAIAAQLISHSQGKEWLINEASLLRFIERYPITLTDTSANDTNAAHPATVTSYPTTTTPSHDDDARPASRDRGHDSIDDDAIATARQAASNLDNDPDSPRHMPRHQDHDDDAIRRRATTARQHHRQNVAGNASDDTEGYDNLFSSDDLATPSDIGEKRSLGEILIENARLLALLEGKEELIETLKMHDERSHEALAESRTLISKLTDDVRVINTKMLETLGDVATGRKKLNATPADDSPFRRLRHHTSADGSARDL